MQLHAYQYRAEGLEFGGGEDKRKRYLDLVVHVVGDNHHLAMWCLISSVH